MPAAPMQPPGELNRFALAITRARRRLWVLLFFGLAGQLLYGVLIANGRKCFIACKPLEQRELYERIYTGLYFVW
jgi:hypothetical protein